jgi:hypothetical protein
METYSAPSAVDSGTFAELTGFSTPFNYEAVFVLYLGWW